MRGAAAIGLVVPALCLGCAARSLRVGDLLGPPVGTILVFGISVDGRPVGRMEVSSKGRGERGSLTIVETRELTEAGPEGRAMTSEDRITLLARDGSLVRREGSGKETVLVARPGWLGRQGWNRAVLVGKPGGGWLEVASRCAIATVKAETVIGETRPVVTVRCDADIGGFRQTVTEKYAAGLGMVFSSVAALDSQGRLLGTTTHTLLRVERPN